MNANVAKAVADEGGINILVNLARSVNRLVAEEAAGGLWNLSVGEDYKVLLNIYIYIFLLSIYTSFLYHFMLPYLDFDK